MFTKKNNQADLVFDYVILLVGLVVTGLLVRAFHLSQEYILFATIPLSIGYVLWGVVHHKRHGHIDQKIFLEYLSMAVLVNAIIGILVL